MLGQRWLTAHSPEPVREPKGHFHGLLERAFTGLGPGRVVIITRRQVPHVPASSSESNGQAPDRHGARMFAGAAAPGRGDPPLGLASGRPRNADVGLFYQTAGGAPIINLIDANFGGPHRGGIRRPGAGPPSLGSQELASSRPGGRMGQTVSARRTPTAPGTFALLGQALAQRIAASGAPVTSGRKADGERLGDVGVRRSFGVAWAAQGAAESVVRLSLPLIGAGVLDRRSNRCSDR